MVLLGLCHAGQQEAARAVAVKPDPVAGADVDEIDERIDRADVHRAELRDDREWLVAALTVGRQHPVEGRRIHGQVAAAGHPTHRGAAQIHQIGDSRHRGVALVIRHVEEETAAPPLVLKSVRGRVVGGDMAQRGGQRGEVRHGAARNDQTAGGFRVADEAGDPAQRLTLDLGGGGGPPPGERIRRRRSG